ncbi:RyR domain-containing protein [Microbispora sp. NPDC049633]|uniref:RyR domain-containing protein n=1 Tax=Microbispora sp. NPDC049633 TaxID=3154355 RepID=UPI00343B8560
MVLAVILGFWGLESYSHTASYDLGRSFWDIAYYDLQLFVLGAAPLDNPGPFPWPLQVARFLAPAATIYALFEAGRAVFASEWRRLRQRRVTGHTIVVGETPIADAMENGLRRNGLVLRATAGDAESLRDAGIAGARFVYACADDRDDSSVNVLVAATARQQARTKKAGDLNVYAHVSDPTYALALRARHLSQPVTGADFFNIDELAARELVRQEAGSFRGGEPLVVVVGLGPFGQAIVVELARMWQVSARADEKLVVFLVDRDAEAVAKDLRRRWVAVAETCELRPVAGLASVFDTPAVPAPHRVYLCHEAEEEAVRAALTMPGLWRGGERSVVVRLDRLSGLAGVLGGDAGSLLDDVEGRLQPVCVGEFVVGADAGRAERIHEDIYERLAQLIHHNYLQHELKKGNAMGSAPAMVPWEDLAEDYRQANRAQARDIGNKLAAAGCTVAPRTGTGVELGDDPLFETLAEREHERWMAERTAQGWTWDEQRDDEAKHHPSLVPWERLPEEEKDKDRAVIREMGEVLAHCGLEIVRLSPLR